MAFYGARMFYYLWDVPIFMAMGAVGGVMGAGFCHFNVKVTQFRHKCGSVLHSDHVCHGACTLRCSWCCA